MKLLTAIFAALAMTVTTAVAGGYVAPVVETTPVVEETAPQFSWTGVTVGAGVSKTGTKLSFDGVDEFGDSVRAKADDDATSYTVFANYRYQFNNNIVGGVEGTYSKTENFFDLDGTEVYGVEAQAGYAFGRVLPYVGVGYGKAWGDTAVSWSVGADYAVTDNVIAGVKYTRTDIGDFENVKNFDVDVDTVTLRVGYKF